jgi:hypothetical protein
MLNFLPLHVYSILFCFLISLLVYSKKRNSFIYLKFFPPFLFLSLVIEVICSYYAHINKNNTVIYNFFSTFEFCFYIWILSILITNINWRRVMRLSVIIYPVLALININFIQGLKTFHTVTYSIGCLLVVLFTIAYLMELFRSAKSSGLITNPAFWICLGLLLFYCCSFPLYGLINYWAKLPGLKLIVKNFARIFTALNIFLYLTFTIAFICHRARKFTLSS